MSIISLHNIKNNWPALKSRRNVFTARHELIKEINLNTEHRGFSNSGAHATTGTLTTVYWYAASLKKSKSEKKKFTGRILKLLVFI